MNELRRRVQEGLDRIKAVGQRDRDWQIYDSGAIDYARSFSSVLPRKFIECARDESKDPSDWFFKYINIEIGSEEGVIAVDLGGPGGRLFRELNPHCKIRRSLGVTLEKVVDRPCDPNHTYMSADIFDKDTTKNRIPNWLGGGKIDLLLEKMEGPLLYIPDNMDLFFAILFWYYKLMSDNSLMFWQLPPRLNYGEMRKIEEWTSKINSQFSGLELQIGCYPDILNEEEEEEIEIEDGDLCGGYFRLRKKPGAPAELPGKLTK